MQSKEIVKSLVTRFPGLQSQQEEIDAVEVVNELRRYLERQNECFQSSMSLDSLQELVSIAYAQCHQEGCVEVDIYEDEESIREMITSENMEQVKEKGGFYCKAYVWVEVECEDEEVEIEEELASC